MSEKDKEKSISSRHRRKSNLHSRLKKNPSVDFAGHSPENYSGPIAESMPLTDVRNKRTNPRRKKAIKKTEPASSSPYQDRASEYPREVTPTHKKADEFSSETRVGEIHHPTPVREKDTPSASSTASDAVEDEGSYCHGGASSSAPPTSIEDREIEVHHHPQESQLWKPSEDHTTSQIRRSAAYPKPEGVTVFTKIKQALVSWFIPANEPETASQDERDIDELVQASQNNRAVNRPPRKRGRKPSSNKHKANNADVEHKQRKRDKPIDHQSGTQADANTHAAKSEKESSEKAATSTQSGATKQKRISKKSTTKKHKKSQKTAKKAEQKGASTENSDSVERSPNSSTKKKTTKKRARRTSARKSSAQKNASESSQSSKSDE